MWHFSHLLGDQEQALSEWKRGQDQSEWEQKQPEQGHYGQAVSREKSQLSDV